jgi:apolipoprotein N-acyltransferase
MEQEHRRTSTEILSKRGGIFWGIVLVIVAIVWLLAALKVLEVNLELILPLVVLLGGLYLLVTKAIR